ncbi:MAG TPA: rhodanese-like domain-containing protein [Anaeromyxobacter sp.]|nr:rhodanese-like domain-containing protein [Anaeromyxobacter sp.]
MSLDPWVVAAGAAVAFVVARSLLVRRAPPEAVRQRLGSGATVLDVRTPREYAGGAYPGALNIPLQSLAQRLGEIPKERPVVVYCASGLRSASAARLLARAGFRDVVNAGGLRHMPA